MAYDSSYQARRLGIMKRIIITVILVIMLLPFTACEEELPPSGEIIDSVIEAMGSVETCRMEGDMTVQLYFMAEEMPSFFPLDMEMTANAEAECDLVSEEIKIAGEFGFAGPDEEPIKVEVAMYLMDEEIYLMYDMPIISPYWMKSALPPAFENMIAQGRKLRGISAVGDFEVIGRERKEGTNCYLLQINTDLKEIIQSILQAAQYPFGGMGEGELAQLEKINNDIMVRVWVDEDTYYIVYESCDVYIEVTPEMMDEYGEEGSFSLDATMNARFYDYNKQIEIILPPEAENAEEIDSW
jgi:hypothetical protein